MDLDCLSITDWRIIKEVYKRPLSLKEIRQETKFPYYKVAYHCSRMNKLGLLERNRSSCTIYSAPSSSELKRCVMDRYYDIMEV